MVYSWEKVIYICVLPILNRKVENAIPSGYYVNEIPIIRVGFLNLSTIYLIDKKGNYKVLNTRKFKNGELRKGDEKNKINSYQFVELEERIIDIKGQNYISLNID